MPAWSSAAPELPKAWLGAQGASLAFGLSLRMALLAGLLQLPASQRWLPALLLLAHEAGTLSGVLIGQLSRRLPWQRLARASLGLLAALSLLFGALQPASWQLAAMALGSSLLLALVTPALSQGLYDYVERRNTAPAIRRLLSQHALLQGLAPLLATWALQQHGPRSYFWAMALLLLGGAWALRHLPPPRVAASAGTAGAAGAAAPATPRPLLALLGLQLLELVLVSASFAHLTNQAVAGGWTAGELAMAFALVPLGCLFGGWLPLPRGERGQWLMFVAAVLLLPLLLRLAYAGLQIGDQAAIALLLLFAGVAMGAEGLAATALRLRLLAAEQAALWQRGGLALGALLSGLGIALSLLMQD